jgi:hypothetical protein
MTDFSSHGLPSNRPHNDAATACELQVVVDRWPQTESKERLGMFRRIFSLLAFALVLGGIGLSNPKAVLAANPADPDGNLYTGSLAGKPINGTSYDSSGAPLQWIPPTNGGCGCYQLGHGTGHGVVYANVDGYVALLYPWHARADPSFDGKFVYGPNNSKIGYWYPNVCDITCASDHDIAVIILYQGNWPANLNRVYLQDASHYWSITTEPATVGSCGNINGGTEWGDVVQQEFNYIVAPPNLAPRTTTLVSMWSYTAKTNGQTICTVKTDLMWHNGVEPPYPVRDSGAPRRLNKDLTSLWGITTGTDLYPTFRLTVSPLYNGLQVYKDSPTHSIHLCHDPSRS